MLFTGIVCTLSVPEMLQSTNKWICLADLRFLVYCLEHPLRCLLYGKPSSGPQACLHLFNGPA